ncbi:MAG: glutaredoxin family protein [Patescibacteria group bacterium]
MEVKIYTTSTCPYCQMAKAFMKENGIEFQEINVAEDQQALTQMVQKSGQMGVPVIEIDGQIVVGFDRPKLAQLLGI